MSEISDTAGASTRNVGDAPGGAIDVTIAELAGSVVDGVKD